MRLMVLSGSKELFLVEEFSLSCLLCMRWKMDSHHYNLQSFYRSFPTKGSEVLQFTTFEQQSKSTPDLKLGTLQSRGILNSQSTLNLAALKIITSSSPDLVPTVSADFGPTKHKYPDKDSDKHSYPIIQFSETCGKIQMADDSPKTETSNEIEVDEKVNLQHHRSMGISMHSGPIATKTGDLKTLKRLAQNREAARKSRLRKKAYVQQLESSRIKLNQLEQELQRTRQGFNLGGYTNDPAQLSSGANAINGSLTPGAVFDMEYSRWMEEHERQMVELRAAMQTHVSDNELRVLVDTMIGHYDDIFRLKQCAAGQDVFHLVSGMWKSPAERCFLWMGGFRPSEMLKVMVPHIEPLTDQQLVGVCNLQQSSQQAEDALSQGMEALQQSLAETLASGSLGSSANVTNYMGQMAVAMGKLGTLESFIRQADNLRQQTLQQMHRILTTRQSARGLLAMGEYCARLRALSSLWSARPRE